MEGRLAWWDAREEPCHLGYRDTVVFPAYTRDSADGWHPGETKAPSEVLRGTTLMRGGPSGSAWDNPSLCLFLV